MAEHKIPDYVVEEARTDPKYLDWWTAREEFVEAHNTDEHGGTSHEDKYRVTVDFETTFSRENDGVLNEQDVEMWLRTGDPGFDTCQFKIVKVRRGSLE